MGKVPLQIGCCGIPGAQIYAQRPFQERSYGYGSKLNHQKTAGFSLSIYQGSILTYFLPHTSRGTFPILSKERWLKRMEKESTPTTPIFFHLLNMFFFSPVVFKEKMECITTGNVGMYHYCPVNYVSIYIYMLCCFNVYLLFNCFLF